MVAAVQTPQYTWVRALGVADRTSEEPMTPDVHHRIGSVTKTFIWEVTNRQETIRRLQRDRETMFRRFSAMCDIDLRHLDPESRRRVYGALRLRVQIDENRDVCVAGVWDTDIVEVLPMAQAPADEQYVVYFKEEFVGSWPGVVALTSADPYTVRPDNAT